MKYRVTITARIQREFEIELDDDACRGREQTMLEAAEAIAISKLGEVNEIENVELEELPS